MNICRNHPEYTTPYISTMAFNGGEYWCPYCGNVTGSFYSYDGDKTDETEVLKKRLELFEELYGPLIIKGMAFLNCSSLIYGKERVKPTMLPENVQTLHEKLRECWIEGIKIEEWFGHRLKKESEDSNGIR